MTTMSDLFLLHNDLLQEIAHHNARITECFGMDAPEGVYRHAEAEIRALHPELYGDPTQ